VENVVVLFHCCGPPELMRIGLPPNASKIVLRRQNHQSILHYCLWSSYFAVLKYSADTCLFFSHHTSAKCNVSEYKAVSYPCVSDLN
jgi:hypothetical protein